MLTLQYDNVCVAFENIVCGILADRWQLDEAESRNGKVLRFPEPVCVEYLYPTQCVLLNPLRNANPFFHLYEALWMLAGRNDLASLQYYIKTFDQYSDDGETLNGAYGYRWRNAVDWPATIDSFFQEPMAIRLDQLEEIIRHLKTTPDSRRAVLQMWNVTDDLAKIDSSKDVCCNLSVCFKIQYDRLQMTVFNRSNDLIHGMLGANAVHFSFLQQYVASALNLRVGKYYQITNDLHIYMEQFDKFAKMASFYKDRNAFSKPKGYQTISTLNLPIILFDSKATWDEELQEFVSMHGDNTGIKSEWSEPFLQHVAEPMLQVHHMYKHKDLEAVKYWLEKVKQKDWQLAARYWLEVRGVDF